MPAEFAPLFNPKSIVVLGASELKKNDAACSRYFKLIAENTSRFKGKIVVVDLSQKLPGAEGNIGKIPRGVDLAVVALPKELLAKNLNKLLSKKVRALVLLGDGLDPKHEKVLRGKKIALLGPGSFGVVNTKVGLAAVPDAGLTLRTGNIAVISYGCSSTTSIIRLAKSLGVGIGKLASVGGGADGVELGLLRWLSDDKETSVVCMYVDKILDGRKFMEAVKEVSNKKPVVVMKGGHADRIFENILGQSGGILAKDFGGMLGGAEALWKQPAMRGKRVALISGLEEEATLAAGYLSKEGLEIAGPSGEIAKKILNKCKGAKINRWVELGGAADADCYKNAVEMLLSDEDVDGVMVICTRVAILKPEDCAKIADATHMSKEKPVVMVVGRGMLDDSMRDSLGDRTPAYESERVAAAAIEMLRLRREKLQKLVTSDG